MSVVRKLQKPGLPLYIQIAEDLEKALARGRHGIGDKLPHEAQLQKDFGVSKFTVRQALKRLEDKGLVEKRHGVGTIVVADSPRRPINYVVREIDDFIKTAPQALLRTLAADVRSLNNREAEALGVSADERYAVVKGVRVLKAGDEHVIAYVKVYVPERYAEVVGQIGQEHILVAGLIERRYGVHVASIRQEISAPQLAEDMRAELRMAGVSIPSERALLCRRWYLDDAGDIVICTENVFVDQEFSFNTVLSKER